MADTGKDVDYSSYENLTPYDISNLTLPEVEGIYNARGFTDEELYYMHSYLPSEMLGYLDDDIRSDINNRWKELADSGYKPPITFANASNMNEVKELMQSNNYKFTQEDYAELLANPNNLYNDLATTKIPRDYNIFGYEGATFSEYYNLFSRAYDEDGNLDTSVYNPEQYQQLADSFRNGSSDGEFDEGFNTNVASFAKTILDIAKISEQLEIIKTNCKSLKKFEYKLSYFPTVQYEYHIEDVELKDFVSTAKDYNDSLCDSFSEMFETVDSIKRNLMYVDEEFRDEFNEAMKELLEEGYLEGYTLGTDSKTGGFLSDAMTSLIKDAYQSGKYDENDMAILSDIIEKSEYLQMNVVDKLLNGGAVFLANVAGGFTSVFEDIVDGAAMAGVQVYCMFASEEDGEEAMRNVMTFVNTEWSDEVTETLLSGTNTYFIQEDGVAVIATAAGQFVGKSAADTVILMIPSSGAGGVISKIVAADRALGSSMQKQLSNVDLSTASYDDLMSYCAMGDYVAIANYAVKGQQNYVNDNITAWTSAGEGTDVVKVIVGSLGTGSVNALAKGANNVTEAMVGMRSADELSDGMAEAFVGGAAYGVVKTLELDGTEGYKIVKKVQGYEKDVYTVLDNAYDLPDEVDSVQQVINGATSAKAKPTTSSQNNGS